MACTASYEPLWRRQLDPSDPYGGLNCTAYVTGFAIDYATCGARRPTGEQVRAMSSEPRPDPGSPGLNLTQSAQVAAKFGVPMDKRIGLPFDTWVAMVKAGHYSILSVGYRPIRDSRFRGSETFTGGHALGVPPGFEVQDPLCDGRRAGIYRYRQGSPEPYPLDLLRRAAEMLPIRLASGRWTTVYYYNGPGRVWASFTPAHPASGPAPDPNKPHLVSNWPAPAEKNVMIPEGGLTVTSSHRKDLVQGQPLFRHPGGPVVAKMSRAMAVPYIGTAGSGWHAVQIMSAQPYADGKMRPTVVYVPAAAGPIHVR
jgi:hypothetical protein